MLEGFNTYQLELLYSLLRSWSLEELQSKVAQFPHVYIYRLLIALKDRSENNIQKASFYCMDRQRLHLLLHTQISANTNIKDENISEEDSSLDKIQVSIKNEDTIILTKEEPFDIVDEDITFIAFAQENISPESDCFSTKDEIFEEFITEENSIVYNNIQTDAEISAVEFLEQSTIGTNHSAADEILETLRIYKQLKDSQQDVVSQIIIESPQALEDKVNLQTPDFVETAFIVPAEPVESWEEFIKGLQIQVPKLEAKESRYKYKKSPLPDMVDMEHIDSQVPIADAYSLQAWIEDMPIYTLDISLKPKALGDVAIPEVIDVNVDEAKPDFNSKPTHKEEGDVKIKRLKKSAKVEIPAIDEIGVIDENVHNLASEVSIHFEDSADDLKVQTHTFEDWLNIFSNKEVEPIFYDAPQKDLIRELEQKPSMENVENPLEETITILVEEEDNETDIKEQAEQSVTFSDKLATETLAKIYMKQGKKEKAIEIFKILMIKIPEKSTYFAAQIKNIEG
jgi:hypothetical protein